MVSISLNTEVLELHIASASSLQLHEDIMGISTDAASEDVDAAWELWNAFAAANDTREAWKTLIAAMLQSPEVLFY